MKFVLPVLIFIIILLQTIACYSQDLNKGLVGYWPLECNARDYSGNGNSGTIMGGPVCENGQLGKAFFFNGKSDYINLPNTKSNQFIAGTGYTWSMWIKPNSAPQTNITQISQVVISMFDDKINKVMLTFGNEFTPDSNLTFQADGSGGTLGIMTDPPTYSPSGGYINGKWYYVTAMMDFTKDSAYLFLDGKEVSRKYFLGSPIGRNMNGYIASYLDEYSPNQKQYYFNGDVDEVRIYNRPLTRDEITLLSQLKSGLILSDTDSLSFHLICQSDSTAKVTIQNTGSTKFVISQAALSVNKDFKLTSGAGSSTISGQDSLKFSIKFTPTNSGMFYDTLTVNNQAGLPPLIIYISGKKDTLSLSYYPIVDFLKVENNTIKDSVITFTNNGTVPIQINSVNPLLNDFTFFPAPQTGTLKPGDTLKLSVRFIPKGGNESDSILINSTTPCGNITYKIILQGVGSYRAQVALAVKNNLEGKPGDIITVPVQITKSIDVDKAGITGFKATMLMNQTLFIPVPPTPSGTVSANQLLINIDLPAQPGSDNLTLAEYPFKVVLGNSAQDKISLINLSSVGGISTIDTTAGIFTLKGVCNQGGARLFESNEKLGLSEPKPNPTGTKVEIVYEIIEKGITKIYIINLFGERKATILEEFKKPGIYSTVFDISFLSAGNYFYILETPTQKICRKLQVIK